MDTYLLAAQINNVLAIYPEAPISISTAADYASAGFADRAMEVLAANLEDLDDRKLIADIRAIIDLHSSEINVECRYCGVTSIILDGDIIFECCHCGQPMDSDIEAEDQ